MRIWRRKILYTQKVDGSNDVGPEIPMGFSNGMGQIGPMMGGSVLIKKIKKNKGTTQALRTRIQHDFNKTLVHRCETTCTRT
jgi:hypothetical protein